MNAIIDRDELNNAMKAVQRVVTGRSSLPVLQNVLIEPRGSRVRFFATDLEVGLEVDCVATCGADEPVTLPAKALADLVAVLPKDMVTLNGGSGDAVELTCGRSRYSLHTLPASEFPPKPEVGGAQIELTEGVLHSLIRRTLFATSSDDTRPVLGGVSVMREGDKLEFAATDTHRLSMVSTTIDQPFESAAAIIPARAMREALRLLSPTSDEPAALEIGETQCSIGNTWWCVTSRLIEGQYPKYQRVIPSRSRVRLTVATEELRRCLNRISVVAKSDHNRVALRLEGEVLHLSASAVDVGSAHEELGAGPVVCDGEPRLEVDLNVEYLLDALDAIAIPLTVLEANDAKSPIVVRPDNQDTHRVVIMPLSPR